MRLRDFRVRRFMTQRELAERSGVGLATIVRLERGQQAPRISTVRRLAAALHVEPGELVRPVDGAG